MNTQTETKYKTRLADSAWEVYDTESGEMVFATSYRYEARQKANSMNTQARQVWRSGKAYPVAPDYQTPAEKAVTDSRTVASKLAWINKSADSTWPKWCVVFPVNRATEWYDTQSEAQSVADNYNGKNL